MATVTKINGISTSSLSKANGILLSNLSKVNGMDLAADSVSLSSNFLYLSFGGQTSGVTVTSSSNWSALKTSDADNCITSFTTNGSTGQTLNATAQVGLADGFYSATIRVTVGSVYTDLNIEVTIGEEPPPE